MFLSGRVPIDWPQWRDLLSQLGGVMVATGTVTFAWELWGRRDFTHEVMDIAGLSTALSQSGITQITASYLERDMWTTLFRGSRNIDILIAYGATWRNSYRDLLEQAARDAQRIRVFLPDPDHEQTMSVLAARFDIDPKQLSHKVREAIKDFHALKTEGGANITVYLHDSETTFSCYLFDQRGVLTLYSNRRERSAVVPTFVVDGGTLHDFLHSNVKGIQDRSHVAK